MLAKTKAQASCAIRGVARNFWRGSSIKKRTNVWTDSNFFGEGRGVARILLTGGANHCSTSAFLGQGNDDFRRKFLPRNVYLLIFLFWKFFTFLSLKAHAKKFLFLTKKINILVDFLPKFTNICMKIFACVPLGAAGAKNLEFWLSLSQKSTL